MEQLKFDFIVDDLECREFVEVSGYVPVDETFQYRLNLFGILGNMQELLEEIFYTHPSEYAGSTKKCTMRMTLEEVSPSNFSLDLTPKPMR